MSDISFNTACKELKIAQIAQLNQLFQLLHLAHIYGHGLYYVSRMLMSKNVNNNVSKDSPISYSTSQLVAVSELLNMASRRGLSIDYIHTHYVYLCWQLQVRIWKFY